MVGPLLLLVGNMRTKYNNILPSVWGHLYLIVHIITGTQDNVSAMLQDLCRTSQPRQPAKTFNLSQNSVSWT